MKRKFKETIRCRICGKYFKNLTTHIIKTHDMRTEDYKKQYGVDYIMSDRLRAKMSDAGSLHPKKKPYIPMNRERLLQTLRNISRDRRGITPAELKEEWTSLYHQLHKVFGKVSIS